MKKSELIFVITPFLLTGLFIIAGYNILTASTPEARITLPPEQANIEILTNGEIRAIAPQASLGDEIIMNIEAIPQNQASLEQLIKKAQESSPNTIYLSLPVTMNPDHSLTLNNADLSSEENIVRWLKTTINTAHQNNFHVALAITLGSNTTISDAALFSQNYNLFITKWAALANEFSVSFFSPGITIGHPIYSNLTAQEVNILLKSTQASLRKKYAGQILVGLCCSSETQAAPGGYSHITIIPTPEYGQEQILPEAQRLSNIYRMKHIFFYNRQIEQVTTIQ